MTSCEKFTDLISARLDGMITPEEEQKLEEHLACCPACRELAQQMSALHAAFPELEEIPAPAGFTQGVMAKIREEQPEPKVVPLTKRPRFKTISGLAACLALCLVLYQTGMVGILGGGRKSDAADPTADVAVLDAVRSVGEEGQVTQRDTLEVSAPWQRHPAGRCPLGTGQGGQFRLCRQRRRDGTTAGADPGAEPAGGRTARSAADPGGNLLGEAAAGQLKETTPESDGIQAFCFARDGG